MAFLTKIGNLPQSKYKSSTFHRFKVLCLGILPILKQHLRHFINKIIHKLKCLGILPILKRNLQQFVDKTFQKSKSLTFWTESLTLNGFRLVHNFNVILLLLKLLLDLCQFLFRNFIHVSWITLVVLQVSLVEGLGLVTFPAHFAKHFGRFT